MPAQECLIRWGETLPAGGLGTYRLWVTAANIGLWSNRKANANDLIDATFVYEQPEMRPKWRRFTDYNRFKLLKEGKTWRFISGL